MADPDGGSRGGHNGQDDELVLQRRLTTLLLDQIGTAGFALAGSGAIREHGITDRLTHDVDLFTTTVTSPEAFAAAIDQAEDALRRHGYRVTRTRSTPEFARLLVEADSTERNRAVEVDLGFDWRADPPTRLEIGPVLSLRDAVGSKVAAVYSRGEARDFLDLDAIRRSGRFADEDLLTMAKDHDPGFETEHFIDQLRWVNRIQVGRVRGYDIDTDQLDAIKTRLTTWADHLAAPEPPSSPYRPAVRPPGRPAAPRPPEPPPPRGHQRDNGGPSIGF